MEKCARGHLRALVLPLLLLPSHLRPGIALARPVAVRHAAIVIVCLLVQAGWIPQVQGR